MKRASYRHGVEIIALNDETMETDLEAIQSQVSVCLLADLFGIDAERVAGDVLRYRQEAEKEPGTKRKPIWKRTS